MPDRMPPKVWERAGWVVVQYWRLGSFLLLAGHPEDTVTKHSMSAPWEKDRQAPRVWLDLKMGSARCSGLSRDAGSPRPCRLRWRAHLLSQASSSLEPYRAQRGSHPMDLTRRSRGAYAHGMSARRLQGRNGQSRNSRLPVRKRSGFRAGMAMTQVMPSDIGTKSLGPLKNAAQNTSLTGPLPVSRLQ